MAEQNFDLIVIGAGPGGYVAAIRAAQLGMKVACVEKDKTLGGTCLNIGCIPSKALLDSSEHFAHVKGKLSRHGIVVKDVGLDLGVMLKRKDQVVSGLTQGIAGLFKKNKIVHAHGMGKLVSSTEVEVTKADGSKEKLSAKNIILATGSEPTPLPSAPFDGKRVVSSTEALSFSEIPARLIVVGGGAIGLEMGSVWSRLGSKVTVVEFQDRIVPFADRQASQELLKVLTRQGLEFKLSTKVTQAKVSGKAVQVEVEDASGKKDKLEAEYVLVAIGRRPFSQNLGLKEIGIPQDKAGRVEVDAHFRTKVPNIYAIGDLIRGPMLAHKAEDEGIAAAEIIAGQHGHVNYEAIPNIVYTWPELASVGLNEDECKAKGLTYKVGTFPFIANGRAKAMDEVEGFVKVIADSKTDRLLGMHIVGPRASDMIAEAVMVMEFGGSAEDIARSTHAHPTLAEVVKEAALAVDKRQIHM
ncbi:MAG: dihydrolipoyl dehydrogenase [Bdellovibrionota bacterium]